MVVCFNLCSIYPNISIFFLKLSKKVDSRVLFIIFAIIFCAYYVCNMMDMFEASPEDYYWKGFLLRKGSDLWYVSFFYVVGMLFAKEKIISRIGQWLDKVAGKRKKIYLLTAVMVVTLGLCIIELTVSIYIFSIFYFICFHTWEKSDKIKRFFLFFGGMRAPKEKEGFNFIRFFPQVEEHKIENT